MTKTMDEAKFILINSEKDIPDNFKREWILRKDKIYIVGREGKNEVDIDLSFDPSVSRNHCKIWFETGSWWIKDLSTYGTTVNSKRILKEESFQLKFDDQIFLENKTILTIIPSLRNSSNFKELRIEIEAADSLNYALLHNGLPFLEKIILRNCGKVKAGPIDLVIHLNNRWQYVYEEVSDLEPGKSLIFNPDIKIEPGIIEGQTESSLSFLKIFINDTLAIEKDIKILAYNEWSKEDIAYHRSSLASFVLPNHPFVEQINVEIREELKSINKDYAKLAPLEIISYAYNYFKDKWQIEYLDEPSSFESKSQKIRFPHQVLRDWNAKRGSGTCIDLSLLFASCLENLKLKPLLFMFEVNPGLYHLIAGCWQENFTAIQPLLSDKEQFAGKVFILDPTGFASGLEFKESCNKAQQLLKKEKFIYALDIAAARRCKILPLPFSGRPKESSMVIKADKKAKELAKEIGKIAGYTVYSPIHILLSLILIGDGFTKEVFAKAGLDINKSERILKEGLKNIKPPVAVDKLKPSEHYELVWDLASNIAKSEGSPFILEKHVFFALTETKSKALEQAISSLGTSQEVLKEVGFFLLKTRPFSRTEKSFFGSICLSK